MPTWNIGAFMVGKTLNQIAKGNYIHTHTCHTCILKYSRIKYMYSEMNVQMYMQMTRNKLIFPPCRMCYFLLNMYHNYVNPDSYDRYR